MAYLKWTKNLATGIKTIDGQHKQIVNYINQLHDAKQTKNREIISKVIEDTIDYTISHFGYEESLIEDAGYEFIKPHKRVHELFIRRVSEYKQRFDSGDDVTEELHGLLSRWLFSHILNDDAAYVPAVDASLRDHQSNKKKHGLFKRTLRIFFG